MSIKKMPPKISWKAFLKLVTDEGVVGAFPELVVWVIQESRLRKPR